MAEFQPSGNRISAEPTNLDLSLAGQAAIAAILSSQIGALAGLNHRGRLRLEGRFARQSEAFAVLQRAVESDAVDRMAALPILTQLPAVQIFTHANIIRVLSVDEEEQDADAQTRLDVAGEIRDALPHLLEAVDSRLVKMWMGAREAVNT